MNTQEAARLWEEAFERAAKECMHGPGCKAGAGCRVGRRHNQFQIVTGSVIDVCIGSANRDERRWERSEEFDIFRTRTPHISFAAGEHTCMGLHLARMETRVAVECLLTRLDDIRLTTDNDPHIHGQPFRSPTALPVTFRSASA